MLTSVVLGQYCRVHQLLFISSLQEWLAFSPAHIAHAFGDAMRIVGYPPKPGHYVTSTTYGEDLMALSGQGQLIDLR